MSKYNLAKDIAKVYELCNTISRLERECIELSDELEDKTRENERIKDTLKSYVPKLQAARDNNDKTECNRLLLEIINILS